jgi:hypothetical protein
MAAAKSRGATIEQVKERYEAAWLAIEGVEGVGLGREGSGKVIKVYVSKKTKALQQRIPTQVEGYPVRLEVSGEFRALPGRE